MIFAGHSGHRTASWWSLPILFLHDLHPWYFISLETVYHHPGSSGSSVPCRAGHQSLGMRSMSWWCWSDAIILSFVSDRSVLARVCWIWSLHPLTATWNRRVGSVCGSVSSSSMSALLGFDLTLVMRPTKRMPFACRLADGMSVRASY